MVLASEALKKGGKHGRFVTVFLMSSETVSEINLQSLKSTLKSAQKCNFFTFKIHLQGTKVVQQNILGDVANSIPLCV